MNFKGYKLNDFELAYIEAMLWASTDEAGEPMDHYGIDDLSTELLKQIVDECNDFKELSNGLLDEIPEAQAGHDFFMTRNRQGTGFWDRGLGEVGCKLTSIAKQYGSMDIYVGDDGLIYST